VKIFTGHFSTPVSTRFGSGRDYAKVARRVGKRMYFFARSMGELAEKSKSLSFDFREIATLFSYCPGNALCVPKTPNPP
jgi:hypothetical protein